MPSHQFVVTCTECEMECGTDDLGEAIEFAVNHHRHTDHDLSWEQVGLVNGVVEIPERTRWKVRCETCDTERLFDDRDDAEAFFEEHTEYTDHSADAIEEVTLPEVSQIDTEDVQEVIDYCFEHSGSVRAISSDAVVTAFEQAGLTRKQAADELTLAKMDNKVANLGGGYLIR
jgi:hypothetical protein